MEPQVINQEILLFTGSSFCSRKFCKRNDDGECNTDHSPIEELEKACWNGMLNDMLPELVGNSMQRGNSYIWNTASGVNFLCINLGRGSTTVGKQTSIDPYFFLYGAGKAN
jgi:hypothetical protein